MTGLLLSRIAMVAVIMIQGASVRHIRHGQNATKWLREKYPSEISKFKVKKGKNNDVSRVMMMSGKCLARARDQSQFTFLNYDK